MGKINNKTNLILGTNLFFHLVDISGTDISINIINSEIISTTTDFTASSSNNGIISRAIKADDVIYLKNANEAANNSLELQVNAVLTNSIEYTVLSGTPIDESAGANINIQAKKKTFQFLEDGKLNFVDGVKGLILSSVITDLWTNFDLDRYDPVFTSIESRAKSLAFINGWEPHDSDTLNAIRDTALEIRSSTIDNPHKIYALLRSNNLHDTTDQFYFWSENDSEMTAPNKAVMTGYINQLVLIYDENGDDNRGIWFTRCAEPRKTIIIEQHNINFAEIIHVYSENQIDPKLGDESGPYTPDSIISSDYNKIKYKSKTTPISRNINGTIYTFSGIIKCNNYSNTKVHEKINWLLRQPININSDSGENVRGDKQWPLTSFSGDKFNLFDTFPDNFNILERNNLRVIDDNDNIIQWPIIVTLVIDVDVLGIGGTMNIYHENTFGSSDVVFLQNVNNENQENILIAATNSIIIEYSTYKVDGHTPNTPLDLRIAYNRPGFIEAGNFSFTVDINKTFIKRIKIIPVADPLYIT